MKRDMDLCRSILAKVEESEDTAVKLTQKDDFPNHTVDKFIEHCRLLADAGLVEPNLRFGGVANIRLTWDGHEFVELSRNDSRWKTGRQSITSKGIPMTIDVVTQVLKRLATERCSGIGQEP